MGQEFAFVFDIVILAIIGCMAFAGWKRGFAKVILSMAAVIVAFILGMWLSEPIANSVYESFIEKPLEQQIDETIDNSLSVIDLGNIPNIDFDKVKISGTAVGEIKPNYAGTGKAVFDLSNVDLSETGIDEADLAAIGAAPETDLTSVNARTADFSMSDIEKYGLGKLVVSQYAAVNLMRKSEFSDFGRYAELIGKFLPWISHSVGADNVSVPFVRAVTLTMIETENNVRNTVVEGIIRPNCIIVIRTTSFILIFALTSVIIGIVANLTQLLNKIPVIGKLNAAAGGVAGLCEGLVTVFVVCLITRFIISLCSGSTLLFNQTTIDSTVLFKRFYETDFLNFLI